MVKYYLGEDYETYVNDSECQKIWPSKQIVQRVIDTKNKYLNKFLIVRLMLDLIVIKCFIVFECLVVRLMLDLV